MRFLTLSILVLSSLRSFALISTGLVADWDAALGITSSSGRISQWDDQHQTLNNDGLGPHNLTQSTNGAQPYLVTDTTGFQTVDFPWNETSIQPTNCMVIPTTLTGLDYSNMTVYAVMYGPLRPETKTLLSLGTYTSPVLEWNYLSSAPARMHTTANAGSLSTFYPAFNPAVFVLRCGPNNITFRHNYTTNSISAIGHFLFGSGGLIGKLLNNTTTYFSGRIFRILIYQAAHTSADMDAQVSELCGTYHIRTNFYKQAVFFGDSMTAGSKSTNGYPFTIARLYPEIETWNLGQPGASIFYGGTTPNMSNSAPLQVELLFNSARISSYLGGFAGYNDIHSGSATSNQVYNVMTQYCSDRLVAQATRKMWIATIPDDGLLTGLNYNALIRANPPSGVVLMDCGKGSPYETRLSDRSNTTYFDTDQIHPNATGQDVISLYFRMMVNADKRSTGFFAP